MRHVHEHNDEPKGDGLAINLQQIHFDKWGIEQHIRRDRPFAARIDSVRAYLSSLPKGRLLDVGCSNGLITSMFAPHDLYGMDISPQSVAQAQANGVNARVGSIESAFPFEAASFDIVFAGEVIEHTVRTDFFLSECNRILRPDGHLIITTPNVNSVASLVTLVAMDVGCYMGARYRSPHVRDFTNRTLRLALANNGFTPIALSGTWLGLPWPKVMEPFVGRVDGAIAKHVPRLAAGLVAFCRKDRCVVYDPTCEIEETLTMRPER